MELDQVRQRLEELVKERAGRKQAGIRGGMAGSSVGSPGQGMQNELRRRFKEVLPGYDTSRYTIMDVGDSIRTLGPDGQEIQLSLPVAADIWYLTISDSILPFKGDDYQSNSAKILGFLSRLIRKLDDISPLKSIQQSSDLETYMVSGPGGHAWRASEKAASVIRTARFETWVLNRSTEFPSAGPKATAEYGTTKVPQFAMGTLYAGMMSFPVGPLGVMEVLAIFSESMIDILEAGGTSIGEVAASRESGGSATGMAISWPEGWSCIRSQSLGGLLSPMTDMKSQCPGVHLVDQGYLTVNRDCEYPAEGCAGFDKILPMQSMRLYFRRTLKWPIPGEFICMIAKPFPDHLWWFQLGTPLLYAGNWMETNYYTSGIVTEVLPPLEGVAYSNNYRVTVRGVSQCVAASDFCDYAVGDRVAIIRLRDLDRFMDATKGNYKWHEMEDLVAREKLEKETPSSLPYLLNTNMMIVPMSFYKS